MSPIKSLKSKSVKRKSVKSKSLKRKSLKRKSMRGGVHQDEYETAKKRFEAAKKAYPAWDINDKTAQHQEDEILDYPSTDPTRKQHEKEMKEYKEAKAEFNKLDEEHDAKGKVFDEDDVLSNSSCTIS
jgi:hypothetical protein